MKETEKSNKRFPYDQFNERFAVPYEYPVYFTHDLFHPENPLLAAALDRLKEQRRHRVIVFVDSGVTGSDRKVLPAIEKYFDLRSDALSLVCRPLVIKGGEGAKNGWEGVKRVMKTLGDCHMDRQSFVMAIGGGSVLDMVGFAAALVHRGLRMVRLPTTVLAQNDAGIGVKNGMNERGQKNFVGAFAPPFAVINDFTFLRTLKIGDWTGGVSEAFKVAIIKDADFFAFLCRNARRLRARNMKVMEEVVRRCAILHLEHIHRGGDPFEMGSARPLDFGHWAGHRLEMLSGNRLGHGQAVAVGIALDSCYAMRKGLLTRAELSKILSAMSTVGLPVWHPLLARKNSRGVREIIVGLEHFREHLGGRLTLTLPSRLGNRCEVNEMDGRTLEAAVGLLRDYARGDR